MAAVRESRGRGRGRLPEGEAPEAHVADEGKRVIKELVARQTATAASLEQQRAREQEREFRRASAVLPLGSVSSGASSLRDFEESAARARRLEELAGAGLAPADLRLLLDHESGQDAERGLPQPERRARLERLQDIRRQLASASGDPSDGGSPGPNRHVQELLSSSMELRGELSPFVRLALDKALDKAGDADADLPRFRDAAPPAPGHPVRRLAALERGMFGHLEAGVPAPPAATSRKRRRLRQAADCPPSEVRGGRSSGPGQPAGGQSSLGGGGGGSLWDVREAQHSEQARPKASVRDRQPHRQPHGPARPKQYTVRDGRIEEIGGADAAPSSPTSTKATKATGRVVMPTGQGVLSREELAANRLTVEQIRQLPRFAEYREGTPTAVLYVKNLGDAATEDDLAAVFGSFRPAEAEGTEGSVGPAMGPAPRLTFRLCGGRMRGQAFVTFPSTEEATAALAVVNGYLLRGRPIIVQYGRAAAVDATAAPSS